MSTTGFKFRKLEVVGNTATSFLSEGYIMKVKFSSLLMCYYKLVHHSNGNIIEVKARPSENLMEIYKNGKKVKSDIIIKRDEDAVC